MSILWTYVSPKRQMFLTAGSRWVESHMKHLPKDGDSEFKGIVQKDALVKPKRVTKFYFPFNSLFKSNVHSDTENPKTKPWQHRK